MLQKLFVCGTVMLSFNASFGQDSTKPKPLSVAGFVDVYYRFDAEKNKANNLTSFTNSTNSFELGMASVRMNYKTERTEVVADLGFGRRALEFSYNDEGILAAIKQLYVSYAVSKSIKLTAGSWATHVGYELVDANQNRNYSMSYMFTNGPFFHTGIKAEAAVGKIGFMLGVANPTDYKFIPEGSHTRKTMLAQYSFAASDNFKAYLNYVGGSALDSSKSNQYDVVLVTRLSKKLGIAYNGTYNYTRTHQGNDKLAGGKPWWGQALYLNYDPFANTGFTLRSEYFSDQNCLKVCSQQPDGGGAWATTLSGNLKRDNFMLIPEVRLDASSQPLYTKSKGSSCKQSFSFLIAAVYSF